MALPKNQQIQDPSTQGVGGLKGLNISKETLEHPIVQLANNYRSTMDMMNLSAPVKLSIGFVGLNDSMYDKDITSATQLDNLLDTRAELLPWYAKLGASIALGTTLAGTTFLDGTVGLLAGVGTTVSRLTGASKKENGEDYNWRESFAGIWDNEISHGLQEINETVSSVLPYYRTQASLERPWWENMGSLDFWADGLLKNMGFMVGAAYSGAAWTKALKAVNAIKSSSTLGARLTGSLFSAVNEGRIEANTNYREMVKNGIQIIDDGYKDAQNKILNSNLSLQEKELELIALDNRYDQEVEQLKENGRYMGNLDLALNTVLLAFNDFHTFGKLYSKGFGTSRNMAKKGIKKSAYLTANELAQEEANLLSKGINLNDLGRYTFDKVTTKQAIKKGLTIGALEGHEEIALSFFGELATNLYSYDSPDSYYKAMTDPSAKRLTMEFLPALTKAFYDTYGNLDKYEEFAIGAISGMLGVPTFGRVQNSDASTWTPKNKLVGFTGGLLGELSTARENNRRGKENVEWMNKLMDRLETNRDLFTQSTVFQNAMDGFSRENNKFEYINSSDNDLFRSIQAFLSAGKKEDLKGLVSVDYENMTPEELAKIAGFTTPIEDNDGNTIGWKNAIGEALETNESNEAVEDIRKSLIKKRDSILKDIDNFDKAIGIVRRSSNYNVNQKENEVNELAWLLWKTYKFKDRVNEIRTDQADNFTKIYERLSSYALTLEDLLNLEENDRVDYSSLSSKLAYLVELANKKAREDKQIAESDLYYIRDFLLSIRALLEATDGTMPKLVSLYEMNKEFLESVRDNEVLYDNFIKGVYTKEEFKLIIDDMLDLGKLYNAYETFMDRFNEYQENPLKQVLNRERIDKENELVENSINQTINRNNTYKITREQVLNGEVDVKEVISTLGNSEEDKLRKAQLLEWEQESQFTLNLALNLNRALSEIDSLEISDEAADVIYNAINKAQLMSDLTDSSSEIYLTNSKGEPVSEETLAVVLDIVSKTLKEAEEASNLDVDINQYEESLSKAERPNKDGSSNTPPVNNSVEQTQSKLLKKENKKLTNSKITPLTLAEKKAQNKREQKQKEFDKKLQETLDLLLGIENILNTVNDLNPLNKSLAARIYKLITVDKLPNELAVIKVLKTDDTYKELVKLLGYTPFINSAIKYAFLYLNITQQLNISSNLVLNEPKDEDIEDTYNVLNNTTGDYEVIENTQLLNAYRRSTSEFAFGKNGEFKPYYEFVSDKALKAKLKALHDFMKANFTRQANTKKGDKIYFTTNAELNAKIGEVVILMSTDPEGKNIVGDLYLPGDLGYNKNVSLQRLYLDFVKDYNAWSKNNQGTFVYKYSSEVAQNMVGYLMFDNNSQDGKNDKSLNTIFNASDSTSKPFTLGVINPAGRVYTSNQGSGGLETKEERKVITPKKRFKNGTPVVLVPTGEGYGRTFAVPFHISKFSGSMKGTMFYSWVKYNIDSSVAKLIGAILQGKNVDSQLLDFTKTLEMMFPYDFHVNLTTKGNLEIHIGTLKNNDYKHIYMQKANSPISSDDILRAIESSDLGVRVNRNLINTGNVNLGNGQLISYNYMIGEIAHNNLLRPSTTGDFFTVYPLDKDGNILKTKVEKFNDTKNTSTPVLSLIEVTYKGKSYKVSNANTIDNSDNLTLEDVAIILAKAEVEKNDTPNYIVPNNIYWITLSNGNLLYNKPGEEVLVSDPIEILAVKDKLLNKVKSVAETQIVTKLYITQELLNSLISKGEEVKEKDRIAYREIPYLYRIDEIVQEEFRRSIYENVPISQRIIDDLKKLVKNTPLQAYSELVDKYIKKVEIAQVGQSVEQTIYPKKFNTPKLKLVFDLLDSKQRGAIIELQNSGKVAQLNNLASEINRLINLYKKVEKIDKNKLNLTILNALGIKLRKTTDTNSLANLDKELAWLKEVLPDLSNEEHLRIHKGLIKVANSENPQEAWGMVQNGVITISDKAAKGTVYHEAFHAVVDTFLSNNELETLYNEGSKLYDIERTDRLSDLEIEENLAEDFRKYVQKEESGIKGTIVRFFRTIKHIALSLLGNESYINNLFYRINRGKLKNYNLVISTTVKYRIIDKELLNIKEEISTFLNNFNISINELQDYDSDLPLFDALNRVINIRSIDELTDGVGYAVAFMMQHHPVMNELISLQAGVDNNPKAIRRGFKRKGDYEVKLSKQHEKELNRNKYLKEIGKEIAALLRNLYGIKPINQKNSFLLLIWKVIVDFFSFLTPAAKSKFHIMKEYTKYIANSIKLNDKTIILSTDNKPGTNTIAERVDVALALKTYKYEESIIKNLNKENIALAGGASVALDGGLFRPAENPLHDLDFNAVPYTAEEIKGIVNKYFKNNQYIRTINDEEGKQTETYLIMDRPFEIRKEIGFSVYTIYDKNTNELIGSFVKSELQLKDGVQGKFLDFFIGENNRPFPNKTKIINGESYLIADARNAMTAKISWSRPKDIWDYNRFITPELLRNLDLNNLQKDAEIKSKLNKARIIWGHPAIGKTTYLETHDDILEWDSLINEERNAFLKRQIDPDNKLDNTSREYKELRSEYMQNYESHPEYIAFLKSKWEWLKRKAQKENKKIFVSLIPLIDIAKDDFDLFINIPEKTFLERNIQRGGNYIGSIGWKELVNDRLVNVDSSKIINTTDYFTDFMNKYSSDISTTVYRQSKVDYNNLSELTLSTLKEQGITEELYNLLTLDEKENLLRCIY